MWKVALDPTAVVISEACGDDGFGFGRGGTWAMEGARLVSVLVGMRFKTPVGRRLGAGLVRFEDVVGRPFKHEEDADDGEEADEDVGECRIS